MSRYVPVYFTSSSKPSPKPANHAIPVSKFVEVVKDYEKQNFDPLNAQFKELSDLQEKEEKDTLYTPPDDFQAKNRYVNILPSKEHRVKLKTESKTPGADFINACYYQCAQLKTKHARYILAQAPVEESFSDFYQMIWDEGIHLIVMLTKIIENNVIKAEEYWPPEKNKPIAIKNKQYNDGGHVTVTLINEELNDKLANVRTLLLKVGNEERQVTHIQYVQWPDHGTPREEFEAFSKFVNLYRTYREDVLNSTILVHCSAGVGRSGVFVIIDSLIDALHAKKDQVFDIFALVKELRAHRPASIQTEQQYVFIHEFIKEYMSSDL